MGGVKLKGLAGTNKNTKTKGKTAGERYAKFIRVVFIIQPNSAGAGGRDQTAFPYAKLGLSKKQLVFIIRDQAHRAPKGGFRS